MDLADLAVSNAGVAEKNRPRQQGYPVATPIFYHRSMLHAFNQRSEVRSQKSIRNSQFPEPLLFAVF
jgi:hypothetical protein